MGGFVEFQISGVLTPYYCLLSLVLQTIEAVVTPPTFHTILFPPSTSKIDNPSGSPQKLGPGRTCDHDHTMPLPCRFSSCCFHSVSSLSVRLSVSDCLHAVAKIKAAPALDKKGNRNVSGSMLTEQLVSRPHDQHFGSSVFFVVPAAS